MNDASPTRVVERMLDHASSASRNELHEVLSPSFQIVEPDSLPYGGVHHGVSGHIALMRRISELFEIAFEQILAPPGKPLAIRDRSLAIATACGRP